MNDDDSHLKELRVFEGQTASLALAPAMPPLENRRVGMFLPAGGFLFSSMLQSGETVCSREVHKVVLAPTNLEDCERCIKFYIFALSENSNCKNRVLTLQDSKTAAISSLNSRSFPLGCRSWRCCVTKGRFPIFLFLFVWTDANTTITL